MKILVVIFVIFCVTQKLDASALGSFRIFNGIRDDITTFHVQVACLNAQDLGFQGGGVLISTKHVLTTASNIRGLAYWLVGFGSSQYSVLSFTKATVAVIHPEFSTGNTYNKNDIGIIFLPSPITLTPNIQIINLPPTTNAAINIGDVVKVRGFGSVNTTSGRPEFLQAANQNVIALDNCTTAFSLGTDAQNFFCASGASGTCYEDAGDGVTKTISGTTYLIGLAPSNANGCKANTPTPYVRIVQYRNWINTVASISQL